MNGAGACSGSVQNAPPRWRIVNPDEAARGPIVGIARRIFWRGARCEAENRAKTHNICG
jgi:hypothetical protein